MKGKEITITIGGRKPEEMSEVEAPVAEMLNEAEMADEDMYDKMAPTGEYSLHPAKSIAHNVKYFMLFPD